MFSTCLKHQHLGKKAADLGGGMFTPKELYKITIDMVLLFHAPGPILALLGGGGMLILYNFSQVAKPPPTLPPIKRGAPPIKKHLLLHEN